MAWFTRITRFADVHLVYAQEQENSCGIACVMMTVFKLNKLRPGTRALYAEREIYGVYGRAANTTYDGTAYSYARHLATTLNGLHVGQWVAENVGPQNVADTLISSVGTVRPGPTINYPVGKAPAIVLVGWSDRGAHFVVVDTIVSSGGGLFASVCDPWDGNVHVTPMQAGQRFNYVGAPVPWSWDLGGTRHEYSTNRAGAGDGWIVRRS
jgi:hypothetical protein